MKKKKFLLLVPLVMAMASCSSFDEPAALDDGTLMSRAGESVTVRTERALRQKVSEKATDITIGADFTLTSSLTLDYPVTIRGTVGKTLTSKAPFICKDSVQFKNLTIDATTDKGQGAINLEAANIYVSLEGVNITQHTDGTTDDSNYEGLAIKNVTCNNKLTLKDTKINMLGNRYVRAINMYTANESTVELELDNCDITCGTDSLTPSTYARVLSFSGGVKTIDGKPVIIKNSRLKGAYYVINSNGNYPITVKVLENSVLSGRAAFNIWSKNFTAVVDNSKLVGINNYPGPTETFATIVLNNNGQLMATGSDFTLNNVTFEMFAKQKGFEATNIQFAIQYRASNQKLTIEGKMTVIDKEQDVLPAYVVANSGVTGIDITVENGATFDFAQANTKKFF